MRKKLLKIFIAIFLLQLNAIPIAQVRATDQITEKAPTTTEDQTTEKAPATKVEPQKTEEKPAPEPKTEEKKPEIKKEIKKEDRNPRTMNIPGYYTRYKSIMYKDENLKKIIQTLVGLQKGKTYQKIVEEAKRTEITEPLDTVFDATTVSIYLNSVLYISKNLWSVWVNGVKVSNYNNGEGEISVEKITPEKVDFLWSINMTKWEIMNADNSIREEVYTLESDHVEMRFSLKPNQSFIPSMNKVIEGSLQKKEPTTKTTTQTSTTTTPSPPEQKPETPETPQTPEAPAPSGGTSLDIFL